MACEPWINPTIPLPEQDARWIYSAERPHHHTKGEQQLRAGHSGSIPSGVKTASSPGGLEPSAAAIGAAEETPVTTAVNHVELWKSKDASRKSTPGSGTRGGIKRVDETAGVVTGSGTLLRHRRPLEHLIRGARHHKLRNTFNAVGRRANGGSVKLRASARHQQSFDSDSSILDDKTGRGISPWAFACRTPLDLEAGPLDEVDASGFPLEHGGGTPHGDKASFVPPYTCRQTGFSPPWPLE